MIAKILFTLNPLFMIKFSNAPTTFISKFLFLGFYFLSVKLNAQFCTPLYAQGAIAGDLISNVQVMGTTLSNNSGTSSSSISWYEYIPPTYNSINYTATLLQGNTYVLQVTIGTFGNQGIAAWIDFNDDYVFSPTEKIGYSSAMVASPLGSVSMVFVVPITALAGQHRLRIRDVFAIGGANIDPCASYNYGETEDYMISIGANNPTATSEFNNEIKNKLKVWPNPCRDMLHLDINASLLKDRLNNIEVFNAIGQLVLSTSQKDIDVSGLKKGVYFLKYKNSFEKIIIE